MKQIENMTVLSSEDFKIKPEDERKAVELVAMATASE